MVRHALLTGHSHDPHPLKVLPETWIHLACDPCSALAACGAYPSFRRLKEVFVYLLVPGRPYRRVAHSPEVYCAQEARGLARFCATQAIENNHPCTFVNVSSASPAHAAAPTLEPPRDAARFHLDLPQELSIVRSGSSARGCYVELVTCILDRSLSASSL